MAVAKPTVQDSPVHRFLSVVLLALEVTLMLVLVATAVRVYNIFAPPPPAIAGEVPAAVAEGAKAVKK